MKGPTGDRYSQGDGQILGAAAKVGKGDGGSRPNGSGATRQGTCTGSPPRTPEFWFQSGRVANVHLPAVTESGKMPARRHPSRMLAKRGKLRSRRGVVHARGSIRLCSPSARATAFQ